MQYSVIRINKKQYKVSQGDEILVDKLTSDKVQSEVLLNVDGKGGVEIGTPTISSASVKIKVLGEEKGKKLHVQKTKAKSRYRKKIGFRPQFTRLQIDNISLK